MTKFSILFVLVFFPFLVSAFHDKFGSYDVNDRMLIYRGVYMEGMENSRRNSKDAKSRISLNVHATPMKGAKLTGNVITAFMTDDAFNNLGYMNSTGSRIPCCDEYGRANGYCSELNTLFVPSNYLRQIHTTVHDLSKSDSFGDFYDVGYRGMFYVVTAVCDPAAVQHVSLSGEMTAENPYGHLPATMYSSLPFYSYMMIVYVVVLIMWGMLCIQYSKEIMSVHLMILGVLVSFVLDYFVKVLYLWLYNSSGYDMLQYPSAVVDALTRTLTRLLTILVCMGLGISRASITDATCKLILFCAAYFGVTLWDQLMNLQPYVDPQLFKLRVYVTAGMDALVYFWVFSSLMRTIDDLQQNKQNAKLAVFRRLYLLLMASVVVSTLTLVLFSYLVKYAGSLPIWKYQWFMNEGIWAVYYFILFFCLMLMWKPSENSAAYAYHSELATDIQEDEEYGLPQDSLVESGDEGKVEVTTTTEEMKPMGITAAGQQA
ncbi:hypothetical protein WA538_004456 [Blastocystis sp. DL]